MIKSLQARNFRSLKNLKVDLGLNNVLVGPNASGKTNIIEALRFLTAIAIVGPKKAITDRLGYPEVQWKGKDSGPIYLRLLADVMDLELDRVRVEYEVEIDGTALGIITLLSEKLTVSNANKEVQLIDFRSGRGIARNIDGSKAFDASGDPSQSALEFNVPGWTGTRFKQYLGSWQFHRLVPQAMTQVNPAARAAFLTETGDNLASWLATLKTSHSENFKRIEQVAKDCFPGLQELVTELTQLQTTFLSSRDEYLQRPVNAWGLSGGELCFIALASEILAPPEFGAPLHCIEEVENHLNPRLLEALLNLHRQWQAVYVNQPSGAAQVVITTHSPYVVDKFDLKELIIVEKREGETKIVRPSDQPHLQSLLEDQEAGLGDLWYSGALGGA
jgi:predicted ATPase